MSAYIDTLLAIVSGDPVFDDAVAEGTPYGTLEQWISFAVVELGTQASVRWGILQVQATAYLAAHRFSMGPGRASMGGASVGGSIAERRARNWALRMNTTSGGSTMDESLRQTGYGLEYLRLRALTRGPLLITPTRV